MTAATVTARPPRGRNSLGLLAHQVRYEQLSFWRNPQSAIFTSAFPVLFVTIIGALLSGAGKSPYLGGLSPLQYYVSTIGAVSVLGSAMGSWRSRSRPGGGTGFSSGSGPRRCRPGRISAGCSGTASW
jgi:hypothetical protein